MKRRTTARQVRPNCQILPFKFELYEEVIKVEPQKFDCFVQRDVLTVQAIVLNPVNYYKF
jgi:hypothetical protein